MSARPRSDRPGVALVLAILLVVTTAALVWFAHRSTAEWRRATRVSVERRASEVLVLLATAMEHDMKGAQGSVLLPINQQILSVDPPYDLAERFGRAFARFPYPESFFTWRASAAPDGVTYFFNRSDRPPRWDRADRSQDPYPVVTLRNPSAVRELVSGARAHARFGTRFTVFESEIAGSRYQTVVHLLYRGDDAELFGLAGFTVNLEWAAREYFPDMIAQVQRIGGRADDTSVEIFDDRGAPVARVGRSFGGPSRSRTFQLFFFDHALWSALPPVRPPAREWTARVSAVNDPALAAATRGAELTLALIAITAAVSVIGLILTTRAVRAEASLAGMRSEFVSTVTHELKTPLALIRLVADTLAQKRYTSSETVDEYAKLLSAESNRLTRLVDNLLTYARVDEARTPYSPERVHLIDVVDAAMDRFDLRLAELGFDVTVDVPVDLPAVEVDRQAMLQVVDNIIDNAIKYAASGRSLSLGGRADGHRVTLDIADRGAGIPADELPRVFDKFFRSRTAKAGGSGLGLAIARRMVTDQGGRIDLRSTPGEGTTVSISLPVAEGA